MKNDTRNQRNCRKLSLDFDQYEFALIHELMYSKGSMYIGASKDLDENSFFYGLIDDVRIYNRALSSEEIAALAQ